MTSQHSLSIYGEWAHFCLPSSFTRNWEGRLEHARHPDTSLARLVRLLQDEHPEVRAVAARHPRTPIAAVKLLINAGSTPDLKGFAGSSSALSNRDWRSLRQGGVWAQLLAIAHPSWDPSAYWDGVDLLVKKLLALQERVPFSILERLLGDDNSDVRFLASYHPASEQLCHQYEKAGTTRRLANGGTPDSTVDPHFLAKLSAGTRWQRHLAASHPAIGIPHLRILANDPSHIVRYAVANNYRTPFELIANLASDLWPPVRLSVARHPTVTTPLLDDLKGDSEAEVRSWVARSLYTSSKTLAALTKDRDDAVKLIAVNNPRTPFDERYSLSSDVRAPKWLRRAAQDSLTVPTVLPKLRWFNPTLAFSGRVSVYPSPIAQRRLPLAAEQTALLKSLAIEPPSLGVLNVKMVEQTDVRDHVDRIAIDAVLTIELHIGHRPQEMSHHNKGFDVRVFDASGQYLYDIEVKGKGPTKREAQISRSQIEHGLMSPKTFRLAIVRTDGKRALAVHYVTEPFEHFSGTLDPAILSVTFDLQRLLSAHPPVWVLPRPIN